MKRTTKLFLFIVTLLLPMTSITALAQSNTVIYKKIKGVVLDSVNNPLIGAVIVVDGDRNNVSGMDGTFTLTNVKKGATVAFYLFCHTSRSIKITNNKKLVINMLEDENRISDTVIIGHTRPIGVTYRKSEINPSKSLEGMMAGVMSGVSANAKLALGNNDKNADEYRTEFIRMVTAAK